MWYNNIYKKKTEVKIMFENKYSKFLTVLIIIIVVGFLTLHINS